MRTWLLARVLETLEGRGARPALIGGMALAAHADCPEPLRRVWLDLAK